MPLDTALALSLFAFVSSVTPGPNNLMLLASGVNFGFRRTLPHLMGVSLGFMFMISLMGLGFSELFIRLPWLHSILKWCGAVYMLYLAWKPANAAPPESARTVGKDANDVTETKATPITFIGAALFQWVNPKAWAMALSAIVTYVPQVEGHTSMLHLTLVVAIFGFINLGSVSMWVVVGTHLRSWLAVDRQRRAFNYVMALLLVLSLAPMIWG